MGQESIGENFFESKNSLSNHTHHLINRSEKNKLSEIKENWGENLSNESKEWEGI